MRKYRDKLREAGAEITPKGWHVTPAHLREVGLIEGVETDPTTTGENTPLEGAGHPETALREMVELLRDQLAKAEARETRALEMLASAQESNKRLAQQLLIESSPSEEIVEVEEETKEETPKKGFFSRLFNL